MNERFDQLVQDTIRDLWERHPLFATFAGVHDYDDRLEDNTPEALEADLRRMRDDRERLLALSPDGLSQFERTDQRLFAAELDRWVREEEELRPLFRSPQSPVDWTLFGTFILLVREFAPLEERLASVRARAEAIPEFLAIAKDNLRQGQDIPPVWVETATEVTEGGLQFWGEMVPAFAERVAEGGDAAVAAAQRAGGAFEDYIRFLTDELGPRAKGSYACGREFFDYLLRVHHMLPYDADDLHEIGTELIAETEGEMERVGAQIDPDRPWHEVVKRLKQEHPAADDVVATYEREMARAREFISEHDLVAIPPGEELEVTETPPFERATIPYAAYVAPAPFEEQQKGIFWVTPVDESAPREAQEQQLQGHNSWGIPVVALHEAYPGHHLQLCHSNRVDSWVRKLFGTSLFAEGWALYCEEMMYETGFYTQPQTRLFQLKDVLWRACRVVIDVGLHTRGMTIDEGVNMLVDVAHVERDNALIEVKRYSAEPTQPMSYVMGKREILRLRADLERARGESFALKPFHDELLSFGTIPVALVREHMLAKG
jgi:uncharacterized protein (DUF885 family)